MNPVLKNSPYFDNTGTNYHSVAFKQGFPVQARELNEAQRILKSQLSNLGSHFFSKNTKLSGVSTVIDSVPWVRFTTTASFQQGDLIKGASSGVECIVDYKINSTDYVVTYVKAGIDNAQTCLLINELLADGINQVASVGFGLQASVSKGVVYSNDTFFEFEGDKIFFSFKEDVVQDCIVAIKVSSEIITKDTDPSLLDNGLGDINFGLEGADREKVSGSLIVLPSGIALTQDHIKILEYKDSQLVFVLKRTEYAELMKILAERMFDTNGNFTVGDVSVSVLNHFKANDEDTDGFKLNGDLSKFVLKVGPIKGYVNGELVETIADTYVTTNKGISEKEGNTFKGSFGSLPYLLVNTAGSGDKVFSPSFQASNKLAIVKKDAVMTNGVFDEADITGYLFFSAIEPLSSATPQNPVSKLFILETSSDEDLYTNKGFKLIGIDLANQQIPNAVLNTHRDQSGQFFFDSTGSCVLEFSESDQAKTITTDSNNNSVSCTSIGNFSGQDNGAEFVINAPSGVNFFVNSGSVLVGAVQVSGTSVWIKTSFTVSSNSTTNTIKLLPSFGSGSVCSVNLRFEKEQLGVASKTLTQTTLAGVLPSVQSIILNPGFANLGSITLLKSAGANIDITDKFSIDNGYSNKVIKNGILSKIGDFDYSAGDTITVKYSYFTYSTGAFVSVDSYQQALKSETPELVDFNSIDFRPVINKETNQYVFKPFLVSHAPELSLEFTSFEGREEYLMCDKNGFTVSTTKDDSLLTICKVSIPSGYKSPNEVTVSSVESARYTMEDINVLEQRISLLERRLVEKKTNLHKTDLNGQIRQLVAEVTKEEVFSKSSGYFDLVSQTFKPKSSLFNLAFSIKEGTLKKPDKISINQFEEVPLISNTFFSGQLQLPKSKTNGPQLIITNPCNNSTVKTSNKEFSNGLSIECIGINGLPNLRYYVYIDGIKIDKFVTPFSGFTGGALIADANGTIVFTIDLPKEVILSGKKEVVVSPSPDANNISQQKGNFSSTISIGGTGHQNLTLTSNQTSSNKTVQYGQTFSVDRNGFISSIKVNISKVFPTDSGAMTLKVYEFDGINLGSHPIGISIVGLEKISQGLTSFKFGVPAKVQKYKRYAFLIETTTPILVGISKVGDLDFNRLINVPSQFNQELFIKKIDTEIEQEPAIDITYEINFCQFNFKNSTIKLVADYLSANAGVIVDSINPIKNTKNAIIKAKGSFAKVGDTVELAQMYQIIVVPTADIPDVKIGWTMANSITKGFVRGKKAISETLTKLKVESIFGSFSSGNNLLFFGKSIADSFKKELAGTINLASINVMTGDYDSERVANITIAQSVSTPFFKTVTVKRVIDCDSFEVQYQQVDNFTSSSKIDISSYGLVKMFSDQKFDSIIFNDFGQNGSYLINNKVVKGGTESVQRVYLPHASQDYLEVIADYNFPTYFEGHLIKTDSLAMAKKVSTSGKLIEIELPPIELEKDQGRDIQLDFDLSKEKSQTAKVYYKTCSGLTSLNKVQWKELQQSITNSVNKNKTSISLTFSDFSGDFYNVSGKLVDEAGILANGGTVIDIDQAYSTIPNEFTKAQVKIVIESIEDSLLIPEVQVNSVKVFK